MTELMDVVWEGKQEVQVDNMNDLTAFVSYTIFIHFDPRRIENYV